MFSHKPMNDLETRIEVLNHKLDALLKESKPNESLGILVALIARKVDEDELSQMMREASKGEV